MKVKQLEWESWWCEDPDGNPREYANTPFGDGYHISKKGWWHALGELNPCNGIEEARVKSQEDFESKALECFGE